MKIAIIGTAGRGPQVMTNSLWLRMIEDVTTRVPPESHVVSGGAAWADHLAVHLFRIGHVSKLTLHLPAPFDGFEFIGPAGSAASASNFYHRKFSRIIKTDSLAQIAECLKDPNCDSTAEVYASGYMGFMIRNGKVARTENLIAYTFGEGEIPADGGTLNTWNRARGAKLHVPLGSLM